MRARMLTALLGAAALAALAAAPAQAAFGLEGTDLTFRNSDGSLATQAGSHPDETTTSIGVTTRVEPIGEVPEEEVKDLRVDFPPGFVGDRSAVPYCSTADFVDRTKGRSGCPDASTLGIAALKLAFEAIPAGSGDIFIHVPVYNLAPPPGVAAKLGFVALDVPVTVEVGLSQSAPYHLVATSSNIPQALLFYDSVLTVWGDPASSEHDPLRGQCLSEEPTELTTEPVSRGLCPVAIPPKPFVTMPRSCTGPLGALFTLTPWKLPRTPVSAESFFHDDSTPPVPIGASGCASLNFTPEIATQPTTASAESPMGLEFTVSLDDPNIGALGANAQSDIKKAVVALPPGVTVNPSAAEGLGVCSAAQLVAESLAAPGCPESSKLGTLEVRSPVLDETLGGSLYQAAPGDNPFGSLLALYMVIKDQKNGILVKMAGRVDPDPASGQLVSTFEDLPQVPISSFKLRFREGPRAPLVSPPLCGTHTTTALLTPWANPTNPIERSATFKTTAGPGGGPCPPGGTPPFEPGFEAGSINNAAGAYSPFYMRITRGDGMQDITRFDSVLPPGVSGKIAGIPPCPDLNLALAAAKSGREELAAPSCPAASQIGRVLVGAGVGSSLTYVPGKIYLAGPHGGHPLSLAVITPAVAGPFDVGTVITRQALDLDPRSAEVRVDGAASDPIPHILAGIPLKLRDLRVYVDRPGFTLNATSCDPHQIVASIFGSAANPFSPADDLPVSRTARYQAASCQSLGFGPRLSLRLRGGTRRSANPALRAELRPRAGEANIGAATVILPRTAFLEQNHIRTICTRERFAAGDCPKASVYGRARAFTPLLDEPLEGPVYLRSNGGARELPDLVADLRGQFRIELVGYIDSVNARIRTRFQGVPDAPVSRFVLNMQGGKKGLIANSANLCRQKSRALARFRGQNNKVARFKPVVKVSCKAKKKKAAASHQRRP